ncbi:MAG TPA: sigma-70 family RNA polymerase sigma factor [Kofleriaceae bacterium]|nr:sigma-70 family RNA polymerase sigma factor [Kofleriaceae bacterium]
MSTPELRALIEAGELTTALDLLYRHHAAEVRRFLEFRVAAAAVDDLVQEVWAAVLEGLPRFRGDCRPEVWLKAIAHHRLVDHLRRQRAHDTLDSQLVAAAGLGSALGLKQPTRPTTRIDRERRAQALQEALAQLDAEERELLALRFVDGLKPAEIVRVLGSSDNPNTVSQRLVRLCRRLRARLEDQIKPPR